MDILSSLPWWSLALAATFLFSWIVQMVMQTAIWMRPLRHLRQHRPERVPEGALLPGVSILVYSHDQGEALVRNLPALLSQDYPAYEVIVIDDASCDDTQDVLTMLDQRYEHLFHSRIDDRVRTMSHRKLGVLLGTKAAHYELIVMTQAQCRPASDQWLSRMVAHFNQPGVEVVLGPVSYERRASFLSRLAQYDLFHRMVRLFGITLAVAPYAGWGQNLAFRKQTFYANGSQGFQRHLNIQPGEDDLFVGDVACGKNVAVECSAESMMTDQTPHLFLGWCLDRLNRAFTSRLYSRSSKLVRWADDLTRYLVVLPGHVLMAYAAYVAFTTPEVQLAAWLLFAVVLLLLLVRSLLMVYAEASLSKALHLRRFVLWTLLADLYLPLVDVWFRIKAWVKRRSFGVGYVGVK